MSQTVVSTGTRVGAGRTIVDERDSAEAIQQRIREAREQLLGGRGPGASEAETARWMRERPFLGGQPTAASRAAVAERAAIARGDPGAIGQAAAARAARLSATLGEIRCRLSRASRRARRSAAAAAVGVTGIALAARAVTRHRQARRAKSR